MKAGRILVNTPSAQGGIGDLYNFRLTPSLTLGCGSWGGNSVSENVGVRHLMNVKTVARRRENMLWFRAPEKVFFIKKEIIGPVESRSIILTIWDEAHGCAIRIERLIRYCDEDTLESLYRHL